MSRFLVWAIVIYRKHISRMKIQCCRYYPSCSEYAIDSITKHGVIKGIIKSAGRVLRCNPLSSGGYDPA